MLARRRVNPWFRYLLEVAVKALVTDQAPIGVTSEKQMRKVDRAKMRLPKSLLFIA